MTPIHEFPEELNMSIMQYMRYEDVKAFLTAMRKNWPECLISWADREIKRSPERHEEILANLAQTETNITIIKHFDGIYSIGHAAILWCRAPTNVDIIEMLMPEEVRENESVARNILETVVRIGTIEVLEFLHKNLSTKIFQHAKQFAKQHRRKDVAKWLREMQI